MLYEERLNSKLTAPDGRGFHCQRCGTNRFLEPRPSGMTMSLQLSDGGASFSLQRRLQPASVASV
jgi:hypothetical protein